VHGESSIFEGTEPGGVLAPEPGPARPRRALVMAGGGLKVAFQAGVLQVWLDEARADGRPLEFAHADGASGGVYNLAMWCQGMSGREIADAWRRFSPLRRGPRPNWRGWPRGASLLDMRPFRRRTLRELWRLDWERIRTTDRSAGFNLFDVHEQQLVTLPPVAMSEDHLVAATSLPGWFPAVAIRGRPHIDGVFVTDANLDAAIQAGADELWVVWTVSTRGRWRGGPVAQYFQVIEACANGNLRRELDRVARSNRAHAEGRPAEYPRPVRVRVLRHEVPVHYLLAFRRRAMAAAVDDGVRAARQWCRRQGFEVAAGDGAGPDGPVPGWRPPDVAFRERMSGPVAIGPATLGPADAAPDRMVLRLDVEIDDLAAFRADPAHTARVAGWVDCPLLGGTRPVRDGTLSLLPEAAPGTGSRMHYRLRTTDRTGRSLVVVGTKSVAAGPPSLWVDTTTLDLRVHPGGDGTHDADPGADPDADPDADVAGEPVLSGRLRITPGGVLRLAASLRRRRALGFVAFFARRLAALHRERPQPPEPGDGAGPAALPGWPDGHRPEGAAVFVHNERVVPAAPDRTWDVLVGAGGWARFYPNAVDVRVDGSPEGRLAPGAVFRWVTFGVPIRCVVTSFDAAAGTLGWTWRAVGARGHHLWWLSPDPSGTRVVTQETQRGPLPRLTRPVLRRVMHAGHDLWLAGLHRAVAAPR
jgi:predicted acylesterase/phospholipase RssA